MMNVEDIEKEIEKYHDKKKDDKLYWKDKEITIKDDEKFTVHGFGICENDNFSIESYRYYLEFEINGIKNDKVLTVLLMNPSNETCPDKNIDNTIQNALKIAYALEYSKVKIFNSFAKIYADDDKANDYYKEKNEDIEKVNKKFVKRHLKEADEILLACGGEISDDLYQYYLKILNSSGKNLKLWTYAETLTKNEQRPRHLSRRSPINRKLISKFINNINRIKYYLKIEEDKETQKLFVKIVND